MKRKRILLCCNRTLNFGGIEKAFTSFLKVFNTEDYEVLLVLHDSAGALHPELPLDKMQVFYTADIDSSSYIRQDIRKLRIFSLISGIWNRIRLRFAKHWYARIMYTYRILRRDLVFPGHFDCAISFTTDYSDLSMIVQADADKRVCFVHGDASRDTYTAKLNHHLVKKMDKIYAVSEQAKELFLQVHPHCAKTADVLHNVILAEDILRKAEAAPGGMRLDGTTILCTVGRLSEEKGQQMIPEAARILRDAGISFRWYVVGDGPLRPVLEEKIQAFGLEKNVFLLGSKSNPYPYVKNCHVYVQTSFSEAYCITVAEARVLCKPIVTTDAPGLREQIIPGENGLIIDAMTPHALAEGIRTLLDNPQISNHFVEYLKKTLAADTSPLQKLYDFIDSH